MIVINGAVAARINGTLPPASGYDTSDANLTSGDLLTGKTAYGPSGKVSGSMPDNADANVEVVDLDGTAIPEGYYDGTGLAKVADEDAASIVPENIKAGVTILGVEGTYEGNGGA